MLVKEQREAVSLDLICVRPGAFHSLGDKEVPYSKVMRSHAPRGSRKEVGSNVEQSCKMKQNVIGSRQRI